MTVSLTRLDRAVDGARVAIQMADQLMQGIGDLRYQPTDKRVRALVGDRTVVDSEGALLVWEPRRVVPYYAVPVRDVLVPLVPASLSADGGHRAGADPRLPFLDHGAFRAHTCAGEELSVHVPARAGEDPPPDLPNGSAAAGSAAAGSVAAGSVAAGRGDFLLEGAAFRLSDPDLADYVVLDFDAFDGWLEEDEPIMGHPQDPFHRADLRRSSRHVQIKLGDRLLAESTAPWLLFETHLPVRFYLPRHDVDLRLLHPSRRRTTCAYKGEASYWSVQLDAYLAEDLVWSYERPLPAVGELAGLMCFFDERVDVIVDGQRRERPLTHWS